MITVHWLPTPRVWPTTFFSYPFRFLKIISASTNSVIGVHRGTLQCFRNDVRNVRPRDQQSVCKTVGRRVWQTALFQNHIFYDNLFLCSVPWRAKQIFIFIQRQEMQGCFVALDKSCTSVLNIRLLSAIFCATAETERRRNWTPDVVRPLAGEMMAANALIMSACTGRSLSYQLHHYCQ